MTFDGTKVAVFLGDDLLVMRRDARMEVPWAGALDWPGGGREPGETPVETALRETEEEVALKLTADDLQDGYETTRLGVKVVKFTAHLDAARWAEVKLGDEGQALALMSPQAFLDAGDAVPSLASFLRQELNMGWPKNDAKVACRTPAEGRDGVTNIPAWKFNLMRGWLRELARRGLPDGVPFKGLGDQMAQLMHEGDHANLGSVGWHMTCVKLEMEVRGELMRAPGKGAQRILPGPKFLDVVTGPVA